MRYAVFLQAETGPNLDGLVRAASTHFDADLEAAPAPGPGDTRAALRVRVTHRARAGSAVFTLAARTAVAADYASARLAEAQSGAAGLAGLAARCPTVCEVDPPRDASPLLLFSLLGALATVGLGPVMARDHSALFGIRTAQRLASDALTADH